ncbi:bifunctional 3,4-dihydroxy-2-butanone-4-phosphate synthase/GTP cyclohydrolase II [Thermoactinomyces sp. DSM 45892]|uniref:bifunctional 3,4-dihydroxy-2-butanone-4-phosphate synthase/GTP cyclohydrolase II n=1 Tax=Thermoactinomyces sp. DSM 45892 TaxID=1882753 RepID=UPI0008996BE2|nr:bifunctional 3,4-dihydroxy-2-butanone-4-phosphate synthase/GTP cyclohydrolase II [Thermoactinomyces sp. DSM 45892]SDZ09017.1 3,4-dihydroxy 2-butanone 4-phosphate synthase / GTP cyclohydrolase II [Thermoactinomyces sp. DSM 45892]
MFHTIEEAIADLKQGKMIIVVDDEDRENEGDLVALAEYATPELVNFMVSQGRGLVCVPITAKRAKQLELSYMIEANENTDKHGTAFTVSVDSQASHTGISAFERSQTVLDLMDETKQAHDFRRPGHIFPLIAREGGVIERPGHTEAAVDLARLCGSSPAGILCEILNEDGTMARVPDLIPFATKWNLKMITIQDLIQYRLAQEPTVERREEIHLPTEYGDFRMIAYTAPDGKEHIALVKGVVDPEKPVLVRVHSECMTGDLFTSRRCDCGVQLHESLLMIKENGSGILIYLPQEGRGIGLLNKMRAYQLQDQGLDTVEANLHLGFPDDKRDYHSAAQILRDLSVDQIHLITNNPRKVSGLQQSGIEVLERVPIEVHPYTENKRYLVTKKEKLGHQLQWV